MTTRGSRAKAWARRVVLAAVLLAIAGVIVWTLRPKPAAVETVTVGRAALRVTVDEEGRARVEDRHVVMAPLGGTLARMELVAGDSVAAGDVIARIATLPAPLLDARARAEVKGRIAVARARKKQVDAATGRAEAAAAFADEELARARRLAGAGAVAGVELQRQQLAAELAGRDLESARFAGAVAASDLATAIALAERLDRPGGEQEELVVRAPVAGRVLRILHESEGVVAPGTPLLELGDPARLEIAVDVLTADAVAIEPGASVSIAGWGGAPLGGRVRLVEPSARTHISALGVEEQRVAVIVDLVDAPEAWRRLGDGWRVEARIMTWSGDDVIQAPLGALFRAGDDWAVFVADGDRARLRRIQIGHRSADAAEVLAGLLPGERVILHPSDRISEGVAISTTR